MTIYCREQARPIQDACTPSCGCNFMRDGHCSFCGTPYRKTDAAPSHPSPDAGLAEELADEVVAKFLGAHAHAAIKAQLRRFVLAALRRSAPEGKRAEKLWLWRNFVDGRPEYWAFDNPYPVHMDSDDPQTLGEPCGYALFKPSRTGRTDVSEEQVIRDIQRTLSSRTRGEA